MRGGAMVVGFMCCIPCCGVGFDDLGAAVDGVPRLRCKWKWAGAALRYSSG